MNATHPGLYDAIDFLDDEAGSKDAINDAAILIS